METIREQLEQENNKLLQRLKNVCNSFDEIIEENKKIICALTIPKDYKFGRSEARLNNN